MISTKGRYALRMMIDLAQHESEGPVPLKAIAERQDISMKYMEAIAALLNRGKLIRSTRGKIGGYTLSRPAEQISVQEVMAITEGSLAPVACMDGSSPCARAETCLTLPMWQQLDRIIAQYLSDISIQALIDRRLPDPQSSAVRVSSV